MAGTAEKAKADTWFGRRAWLLAVGLVLAQSALLAWDLESDYRSTLETEYARLGDAARIADENISGSLRAIDLLLRDVGEEYAQRGTAAPVAMSEFMATRARGFPEVRTVMVTNPEGIITATTRPEIRGWDIHDRSYFTQVRSAANWERTFFTPLTLAKPTNVYVIFVTRALPTHDGQWAGIVSATLEIKMFDALLASIRPDDASSAVAFVGKDGRIISRVPDPERFVGLDISKGPHFQQHVTTGQKSSFYRSITRTDGVEKISAARTVADGAFALFVSKSVAEVLASWRHQAIDLGIGSLALSIALLSFTGLAIRHHRREACARALAETAQERIEFLAYHDTLTGLPNRVLAEDRMKVAMAYADRSKFQLALLLFDLDNFKTINDTFGHQFGDEVLKGVANRLVGCMRDSDTVSRYGGDKFLVVIADARCPDAVSCVAEKILQVLAEPLDIEDHIVSISASIGIAVYPEDGRDFETLLRKVDTAMYQAKEVGRNTCRFFDQGMTSGAEEHLRLRHSLLRALEYHEFVLHYQPLINLASGDVIGAEALIRWKHPELGVVPPGRFIPVAEDNGLIVPIGEWVLHEACQQLANWQKDGLSGLVVAVNLSALQFKRGNLEASVVAALDHAGLDPACLELELTESILIKDVDTVLATVKRLKALGLRLSIDDFGTGYSSLAYLKRFKVDKLKIDQSFVRDLILDPEDATIVRTIIQMARSLNLRTIAEGVENEATLHHLRGLHCDEAQGYHIARPMPADAFAEFVVHIRR
ncbi:MAG: EAL domain-containing protein [Alphaproteobacteria bacterium]|nr:EAL domain-containing protein [Alphaproteobacteria bacterium]